MELGGLQGVPQVVRIDENIVIHLHHELGSADIKNNPTAKIFPFFREIYFLFQPFLSPGTAGRQPLEEEDCFESEVVVSILETLHHNVIGNTSLSPHCFLKLIISFERCENLYWRIEYETNYTITTTS